MKKFIRTTNRKYGQVKAVAQVTFSLLDPKGLRASFSRIMWLAVMLATGQKVGRVAARTRRYNHVLQLTMRIARHHGLGVAIKWLKACHVALMRFVGGAPLVSLRRIEKTLPLYRLAHGLPTCIGPCDRAAIRRGDESVIRLYMTIFGSYRVLSAPLNPKLNTITDECKACDNTVAEFRLFLESFWPCFQNEFKLSFWLRPQSGNPPFTVSAGPNTTKAVLGTLTDAIAVWHSPLRDTMIAYAQMAGLSKFVGWLRMSYALSVTTLTSMPVAKSSMELPRLGQLSFKVEAAGKLRVFAIVDYWTQWLLAGLHESLMSNLAKVPMDGTHDHAACAKRAGLMGKKMGAWSVDISSATDRIPLSIQEYLLNTIFQSKIGFYWGSMLSQRDFVIPKNDYGIPEGTVRYRTGQPMGARSSWPMLALTHHMLVQWAAVKAGVSNGSRAFRDYSVIGDDLVIHNYEVYVQYLRHADLFDYGISEAKSLPSKKGVVELAKKVMYGDVSLSSIAVKQLLASLRTLSGRVQNVLYFAGLGLVSKPAVILAILARSKQDYLKTLQKTSVGSINSIVCLLTAGLGTNRLAESVEFLVDPVPGSTGRIQVQRILLFVNQLLTDPGHKEHPIFYKILDTRSVIHSLCNKLLENIGERLAKLQMNMIIYHEDYARRLLVPVGPDDTIPEADINQLLPLASFVLSSMAKLEELQEAHRIRTAWIDDIPIVPASSILLGMVSLPRVRKDSNWMLSEILTLLDQVIALENRVSLKEAPRQFTREHGWLLGTLAPLTRAQKVARSALNIAGRPKSRFVGTW